MKISQFPAIIVALMTLSLPACQKHEEQTEVSHKIVTTSPKAMDVTITQQYVCQIHSQRHIKVRALQSGYLQPILVKEGELVKEKQVLFSVIPTLYEARLAAEVAEAKLAELERNNTQKLYEQNIVSLQEVALYEAKLLRAKAKAELAKAELDFTKVKAPFNGIIDRLHEMQGSLVKEGDALTTLSDNSVMWVYFNVPEARYLEYQASSPQVRQDQRIELMLANGSKFPYASTGLTVEAKFNNETGTVPFRADFPNSARLLRHGMTGTILIYRTLKGALVIPQRAAFETLDKRYVYVVDDKNVVHQRAIVVEKELPDIFVIKTGLSVNERFVYEGVQQVHDGQKVEDCEFRPPAQILAHQQYPAE